MPRSHSVGISLAKHQCSEPRYFISTKSPFSQTVRCGVGRSNRMAQKTPLWKTDRQTLH